MSYFTRENPRKVVSLKDDAPQWVLDCVRECHQGAMPCDWVYEQCASAFEFAESDIKHYDSIEDAIHEYADREVDVDTQSLYQWAADMCLTDVYSTAESEANDCGQPEETKKRLAAIQYFAIRRIAEAVCEAIKANRGETDE